MVAPLNVAVYEMLISFLQSAVTAEEDALASKIAPSWVIGQLRNDLHRIAQCGPSPDEKERFYRDCLGEIRSKGKTATASIIVIVAFLRPILQQYEHMPAHSVLEGVDEVKHMFHEMNLHVAVVEELRFFVDKHRDLHSDYITDALRTRMDLIETIIRVFPEGLTPTLSSELWNCLMGSHSIGPREREVAFDELANLAHSTVAIREKREVSPSQQMISLG